MFDENLSWRLVKRLSDIYPTSQHVKDVGLERGADDRVWETAKSLGLAIVSKDDDFRQRALLFGAPPKTIWVRLGNCSTDEIELQLRFQADTVRAFLSDAEESMLILQSS
ncbi:MAG: DUF5615 family PIN-like protein [Hyphomonadaceae bacterium]|nr:DUF5615 family PIN-like protein [Hyphomonadaceae bacterium]